MSQTGQTDLFAADGLPARPSGEWIRCKHHYLKRYCDITAKGMKHSFPTRVFVDVMAGPGVCKIRETGEEMPGSPLIALEHEFTMFVFVEADPTLAAALEKRVAAHPKAQLATVICEDWAKVVADGRLRFNGLVVAFVDPTGISQVSWTAMERLLLENPKIDLLMTLQYAMGITLNAYQYIESHPGKTTALDIFLGEREWRQWERARTDPEFTERVLSRFLAKLADLGFQNSR